MPPIPPVSFVGECHSEKSSKRAPRPPNAFFLFRSDLIKRQAIPPGVEKHQQNLSRIAGQCWNMLPESEKAIWYSKAAVVRAEYDARHSSEKTESIHKDTNKGPGKAKRKEYDPQRSSCRSKGHRTRSPYHEGMFAALHDSTPFSAPQPRHISPGSASDSVFSATASLTPLFLSDLPHSFSSYTNASSPLSPPATSQHPTGDDTVLASLGSEILQCVSQNVQSENGCSLQLPRQYDGGLATSAPYPTPEQFLAPCGDPVPQTPSTSHYLSDHHLMVDLFGVTDNVVHLNPSWDPLYL